MSDYYAARQARNEESLDLAGNHKQPWDEEDHEFLMEFFGAALGDADAEAEVAEALGRTIEACRQKYYTAEVPTNVVALRPSERPYIGAQDDDEDRWWE